MATKPRAPDTAVDKDDTRYLERVRRPESRDPTPRPRYDLVIVGAGPAGLAAARTARAAGLSVALVERRRLGGTSLNVGSIPSKSMIRSGRAFEAFVNSEKFGGPRGTDPVADLPAVMSRIRRIRTRLAEYCSVARLTAEGIDLFFDGAIFAGRQCLQVGSIDLQFDKAIIATGARPSSSTIPGLEEAGYLTSETIFDIETLPKRLAIIGGGPMGCEMAQAFAHMGSQVTILESEPKFLPREERDAAELLSLSLSRSGVDTRLNTRVLSVHRQRGAKCINAELNGIEYSIAVDEILLSIGLTENTEDLNLQAAGIERTPEGCMMVDDLLRTTNASVFAAGDVCLTHKFTNIAEASGRMAVLNAFLGGDHRRSQMIIPWCTFCDPEIAHVGLQVWDARRESIPVKSFTVMMQDVDRAITDGRDEGFVKIHVREGTDEILGATIVASRASEMINEISVIMNAKVGMRQLAGILHTYPAQSDAIRLAAVAYLKSSRQVTPG